MLPLLAMAAIGALGGGGLAAARHGNMKDILKGAALGGIGGGLAPTLAPLMGLGAAGATGAAGTAGGTMAAGLGSGASLGSAAGASAGAGAAGAGGMGALSTAVPTLTASPLSAFLATPAGRMATMGGLGLLTGGPQGAAIGMAGQTMDPSSFGPAALGGLLGAGIGGDSASGAAGMAMGPQLARMRQMQQSVFR